MQINSGFIRRRMFLLNSKLILALELGLPHFQQFSWIKLTFLWIKLTFLWIKLTFLWNVLISQTCNMYCYF